MLTRRELGLVAGVAGVGLLGDCCEVSLAASQETRLDAGLAGEIPEGISNAFAKSHGCFLVREKSRLYSVSSDCTHRKCSLKLADGEIRCPCHASRFTSQGKVTKGPAKVALAHFAVSLDDKGHLIVDLTRRFEEADYEAPGSFVTLPA